MRRRGRIALLLVGSAVLVSPVSRAAVPITGAPGLARAYGAILDQDFDEARQLIAGACPPAPETACLALDATRLLWQIQIDPEQTAHDTAFNDAAARGIAAAEAWTAADPQSAEAWFYLGGAYGARVQWKVLRRQHLSAARDGRQVKLALDRALTLESTLDDAHFGLGLYEYYAAIAPAAARVLRVLLGLPGGDRARGLTRMERTRSRGVVLADEAAYQLHVVYLWYENRPQDGLALARTLVERHPRSPYFRRVVAEILDVYMHDRAASLAAYRELASLAAAGRVNLPELAEAEARLGMAAQLDALGDTDLALVELDRVVSSKAAEPWGAQARAALGLARGHDRLGDSSRAQTLYRSVMASMSRRDPLGLAAAARRGLARPTPPPKAEAHRIALAAWRDFERHPSAAASLVAPLEKALALDPANHVARYRYARVLAASGDATRALDALDRLLKAPADAPPTVVGDAALAAGGLREQLHDRAGAAREYQRAAHTFGASAETRDGALRALARLDRARP